ncbi:MAG: hydantoinase/oxoprolinase family protein [Arenicellales bacterium]|jgi:N-methylhydantoinase A/oxoprolinase/acetone carboxylase beta subunit|nr:hydantoinase/oxoprolinase family protein [Arenicellales bacterium]|tara:strand:- start:13521 stop:15080 length:1560 start_codon:yes stop_codon:yes gene_type:complete
MRIGVDVGGTNTDAVLMDGTEVLATHKSPTTADVSSGIVAAIRSLLNESDIKAVDIEQVMIGTTHFTNAFVECRELQEVGILRLGLPATAAIPPLTDWPDNLADAMGRHIYLVDGGYEYDGREISAFNEKQVLEAAREFHSKGIGAVAISCVFSTVNGSMEERAAEIVRDEIPDALITCSSYIGSTGLLARENAAIINCSLSILAGQVMESFTGALVSLGIKAPLYISQNDGTLMTAEFAARFPALTFASGPTNSMRGAAYLSGEHNAIVLDIGGTTSDVGMLTNGFPRQAAAEVRFGGVRTNFRMPDILSIGLGGGSIVHQGDPMSIGPNSVGYELMQKSLVFGGSTLTATDVAVALHQLDIGTPTKVSHLDKKLLSDCNDNIHEQLSTAIDHIKTSADALPVVLVGGGSILVTCSLTGASKVISPEHSTVANAIGAAIAQIGGDIDRVYIYETLGREQALEAAKAEAIRNAVDAGAAKDSVEIVMLEEVPLAYMPGGAVRVRVKAVGDLVNRASEEK